MKKIQLAIKSHPNSTVLETMIEKANSMEKKLCKLADLYMALSEENKELLESLKELSQLDKSLNKK